MKKLILLSLVSAALAVLCHAQNANKFFFDANHPSVLIPISPEIRLQFSDIVAYAESILDNELEPAIDKGSCTMQDLQKLAFCLAVMKTEARQYSRYVEENMKIPLGFSCPNLDLIDTRVSTNIKNFEQNRLNRVSAIRNGHKLLLESFCAKYNTDNGTQLFMNPVKLEGWVKEMQYNEQCDTDSYGVLFLDSSKYGDYPKLKWWAQIPLVGEINRHEYFTQTVPATKDTIDKYLAKRPQVKNNVWRFPIF